MLWRPCGSGSPAHIGTRSDAMNPEARSRAGSTMPRGEPIAKPAERARRLAGSCFARLMPGGNMRFASCRTPCLALGVLLAGCSEPNQPLSPKTYAPQLSKTAANGGAGKITFQSNRSGNFDIFVMNADGSGVTQVTSHPFDEYLPLFSPDGSRIVFGRCHGICDIVVINADGSGLVRVLGPDFVTDWSPDGRQLMIVSNRDGDYELYATPLDGSPVTKLTDNTADDNAGTGWSPDGSRIAFDSDLDGPDRDIFVMNADGTGVTDLTHDDVVNEGGAAWSPDGRQLAFDSDRDGDLQIFTMNADGSGVTQLTFGAGVINAA